MRRSVNNNIAQPLRKVFATRQTLWQITHLSTYWYNEQFSKCQQATDSRDETTRNENCSPSDATSCRHPPGNYEIFYTSDQRNIDFREGPINNDEGVNTTIYYDPSFFDKEDVDQYCTGLNRLYRVVAYHTSASNEMEFRDHEKAWGCKNNLEGRDYVDFNDSKENYYANELPKVRSDHNKKLKQFTESIKHKIEKGSYASSSTFNTLKPHESSRSQNDRRTPSNSKSDDGSENVYIRSILNGIPRQIYSSKSNQITNILPVDPNDPNNNLNEFYKMDSKPKDASTDESHKGRASGTETRSFTNFWETPANFGVAIKDSKEYSQETYDPKRKSGNLNRKDRSEKQTVDVGTLSKLNPEAKSKKVPPDSEASATGRDMFVGESQNPTSNDDFRTRNYSLRNGFEPPDILKRDSVVPQNTNDRTFHSSSNNPKKQPKSSDFEHTFNELTLQGLRLNNIPVKPEYPVYKKGSFGSEFKKYNRNCKKREQKSSNTINTKSDFGDSKDLKNRETELKSGGRNEENKMSFNKTRGDSTETIAQSSKSAQCKDDSVFKFKEINLKDVSFEKDLPKLSQELLGSLSIQDNERKSEDIVSINKSDETSPNPLKVQSKPDESSLLEYKSEEVSNRPVEENKLQNKMETVPKQTEFDEKERKVQEQKSFKDPVRTTLQTQELSGSSSYDRPDLSKNKILKTAESNQTNNRQQTNKEEQKPLISKYKSDSSVAISPGSNVRSGDKTKVTENRDSSREPNQVVNKPKVRNEPNEVKKIPQVDKGSQFEKKSTEGETSKDNLKESKIPLISNKTVESKTQESLSKKESKNSALKDKVSNKLSFTSKMMVEEEKEKESEITFPGITPPTFYTTVSYENGNKTTNNQANSKRNKSNGSEAKEKLKATNKEVKDAAKVTPKSYDVKPGKSNGLKNNSKQSEGTQNGNENGKTGLKKEIKSNLIKPGNYQAEMKKLATNKQRDDNSGNQTAPCNGEKLATMLKEHRVLLELLLEKLNSKASSCVGDSIVSTKKVLRQIDKSKDPDNVSINDSNKDNCKVKCCSHAQEKLSRLYPRRRTTKFDSSKTLTNEPEEKGKKVGAPGQLECSESNQSGSKFKDNIGHGGGRGNFKPPGNRPYLRFHRVTMMTSPSGKRAPEKNGVLDAAKLAKFNYSPLKHVLSQCRVDWTGNLSTTSSRGALFGSSERRKWVTNKSGSKRNFSYTALLQAKMKNEKPCTQKEVVSHVRKITLMNKKKNYTTKHNIKKGHLNTHNKIKSNNISTLLNVIKSVKKGVKDENKMNEGKTEEKKPKPLRESDFMTLAKGIYFDQAKRDFHKSTNGYLKPKLNLSVSYEPSVDYKVRSTEVGRRRLKDDETKFKFVSRTSVFSDPIHSGLENKFNYFSSNNSNHIVKGPPWILTPEYNIVSNQWKPLKVNKSVRKLQGKQADSKKDVNLSSLSKKIMAIAQLSKSNLPKSNLPKSNLPALKPSPLTSQTGSVVKTNSSRKSLAKTERKKTELYDENQRKLKEIKILGFLPKSKTVHQSTIDLSNRIAKTIMRLQESRKKCSGSVESNSNMILNRIKRSGILNAVKPSINSFRSISNKYYTKLTGSPPLWNDEIPPKKGTGENNVSSTPTVETLKMSWIKITDKVKHYLNVDSCKNGCEPDFDKMISVISKNMEKNAESVVPNQRKHSDGARLTKETRIKELLLTKRTEPLSYRNPDSKDEPQVTIIPRYVVEGSKII